MERQETIAGEKIESRGGVEVNIVIEAAELSRREGEMMKKRAKGEKENKQVQMNTSERQNKHSHG